MRALIWKEVREGLGVWAAFAVTMAVACLAMSLLGFEARGYGLYNRDLIVLALVSGLAALVFPAAAFAGERERRTFDHLTALPASRLAIWGAKAVTSLGFAIAVAALGWIVMTVSTRAEWLAAVGWADLFFGLSLVVCLWAISTACAIPFRSAATALAAGLAAGGMVAAGALVVINSADLVPLMEPVAAARVLLAVALLAAAVSARAFSRQGAPVARPTGRVTVAVLCLSVLLAGGAATAWFRLAPRKAQVAAIADIATASGKPVYFTARDKFGRGLGVWYVTTDGISYGRLTSGELHSPVPRASSGSEQIFCVAGGGSAPTGGSPGGLAPGGEGDPPMVVRVNSATLGATVAFRAQASRPSSTLSLLEYPDPEGLGASATAVLERSQAAGKTDSLWLTLPPGTGESLRLLPAGDVAGRVTFLGWGRKALVYSVEQEGRIRTFDMWHTEWSWRSRVVAWEAPRELSSLPKGAEILAINGRGTALFASREGDETALSVGSVDGGPGDARARVVSVGAAGSVLAWSGHQGFFALLRGAGGDRVEYFPFAGGDRIVRDIPFGATDFAVSSDDRFLAAAAADGTLWSLSMETGRTVKLADGVEDFNARAAFFHPRKVAFARGGNQIWVADVDSAKTQRIF